MLQCTRPCFVEAERDMWDRRGMKPQSVVINPTKPDTELPQSIEQEPQTAVPNSLPPSDSTNHQTRRLEFATVLFTISMFLNWGTIYWITLIHGVQDWFYNDWYYYADNMNGISEIFVLLGFLFDGLLFESYSWVGQEAGPLVLLLIILRDVMPIVFIGIFVVCWSHKGQPNLIFERVGMFSAGYSTIMGLAMFYIIFQHAYSLGDFFLAIEILFESFGFLLAVFVGFVIHPNLVPLPQKILEREPSTSEAVFKVPYGVVGHENYNELKESNDPVKFASMALFYFPLLYLLFTVLSVTDGGNDDALFMGTVLPGIGLIVGLAVLRLEFLKGFGIHLLYSLGYSFMGFFMVLIGFGVLEESIFLIVILVLAIAPVKEHLKKNHARALGAAYAIPLCFFIVMIGIILGLFQVGEFW